MNTIAMLSTGLGMHDAAVVVTSVTLVFGMLVALCLIIVLEGKIFASLDKKKQAASQVSPAPKAEKPAAVPAAAPAPAVERGISGEVVAAIAAAVAFVTGGNGTVRSVRRAAAPKGSRRGAWGDAGVDQNTRPFV